MPGHVLTQRCTGREPAAAGSPALYFLPCGSAPVSAAPLCAMTSNDRGSVEIRILATPHAATVIRELRETIQTPVATLAAAVNDHSPIRVAQLYGLDHTEQNRNLQALLRKLDRDGVSYALLLDGEEITAEHLKNALRRWREIGYDVAMETDLETGDPGPEALRWATGDFEYPPDEDEA